MVVFQWHKLISFSCLHKRGVYFVYIEFLGVPSLNSAADIRVSSCTDSKVLKHNKQYHKKAMLSNSHLNVTLQVFILSLKSQSQLVQPTKWYHCKYCFSKKISPTKSNLKTADIVNGNPRYITCKHQVPTITFGKQEESIRKVVKNLPKLTTISCGLCFQAFTAKIAEIGRVLLTSSMLNALPNQVIFCRRYLLLNFKSVLFP